MILIKKYLLIILFGVCSTNCFSQTVSTLTSGTKTSIRGLSVVNDRVIWASGSNGMVARSLDSGKTWKWLQVKGFEKIDFRDIEAFNETSAVIMAIAEPAYILKTIDGGETWKVVYENKTKGMFLDAMEFWNDESGIVIGDPVNKKFFISRTFDGGTSWRDIPFQNRPEADSGEACFASSGTNIRALAKDEACFISGGLRSRLFIRDRKIDLPILQGKESTGTNSIAIKKKNTFIVVGGDFTQKDSAKLNCFITTNAGKTWTAPAIGPHGYRSCVEYLGKSNWICCGLNGVDYSADNGKIWHLISDESFNVCRRAKEGRGVFFAGANGKIGKLSPL
jgi:photosystem II stability/assembly factor-like uncharacterized protein